MNNQVLLPEKMRNSICFLNLTAGYKQNNSAEQLKINNAKNILRASNTKICRAASDDRTHNSQVGSFSLFSSGVMNHLKHALMKLDD